MSITSCTINGRSLSSFVNLILLIMYFQYKCTHLCPASYYWWVYFRACPYELSSACFIVTLQYACVICMFTNWNSWLVNHKVWYIIIMSLYNYSSEIINVNFKNKCKTQYLHFRAPYMNQCNGTIFFMKVRIISKCSTALKDLEVLR